MSNSALSQEEKIALLQKWLGEEINVVVELDIGAQLSSVLKLRRDREHKDRWQTEYGTKTDLGVYRVVADIIIKGIQKHEKESL